MSAWDHESRSLFSAAREELAPPEQARARVRARLAAKLGTAAIGVAAATAVTTAAASGAPGAPATVTATVSGASAKAAAASMTTVAAKGGALALAVKLAAPFVLAGALASAFVAARRPEAAIAPPRAVAASMATPATPATPVASEAAPETLPVMAAADLPSAVPNLGPPRRATKAERISPPSAGTEVAPRDAAEEAREEAALVSRIDAELRAGRPSAAAKLAAEHERRFPRGLLVEEREGARVLARCATLAEGRRAGSGAEAYLASHPRSPLRERILATCLEP